jgi:hypothetical protein
VAEYFLGVPVRREKEEVGTIMFVEKVEPEILRQSVQWHIACDEWLARLWFVKGGREGGEAGETYTVGWFSFVRKGDFTTVA